MLAFDADCAEYGNTKAAIVFVPCYKRAATFDQPAGAVLCASLRHEVCERNLARCVRHNRTAGLDVDSDVGDTRLGFDDQDAWCSGHRLLTL